MADRSRRRLVGGVAFAAVAAGVSPVRAEPVQTRNFPVADFTQADLQMPADFELTPSSAPGVRITAKPKVLSVIRVEVNGGRLVVRADGSYRTREVVRVTIGFRRLAQLRAGSSASVSLSGLRGDRLVAQVDDSASLAMTGLTLSAISVDLNGSGSVSAAGQCATQQLRIEGAGSYDAQALKTDRATVEVSGAGDVTVFVQQSLDVTISGAGSVRYAGNPKVTQRIDGAGSLDKI